MGFISFVAFPDFSWVGIIVVWILIIAVIIISWLLSGLSFGDWLPAVGLYGVRKLARAMTKLSKKEGDNERKWWEPIFEIWWGFMIKYFVPFALWWMLVLSVKNDFETPYGGYHWFWQFMGAIYPLGGLMCFIVPLFICTTPEPFEHDIEEEFAEDNKAVEQSATPAQAPAGEVEMSEKQAINEEPVVIAEPVAEPAA